MVLSLAPIIKGSVTKPNVSLTQARITKAQKRFRHAGSGRVGEAGEGHNLATLKPYGGAGGDPPSTAPQTAPSRGSPCSMPRGCRGAAGDRPGPSSLEGRCWGMRAARGRLSPAVSPPPCKSRGTLVTTGHARCERRGHVAEGLAKAPKGRGKCPNMLTSFHKGTSYKSRFTRRREAGLCRAALRAGEQKAA